MTDEYIKTRENGKDKYGLYVDLVVGEIVQRMRWVDPGEFSTGYYLYGVKKIMENHEVVLTRGYWLSDTACTQALWQSVMGNNPSNFKGEERPVENVSWNDCQVFISTIKQRTGIGFRLPTEAEWEYACRAGTTTKFFFGDFITPDKANYNSSLPYTRGGRSRYRKETVDVKSLPCNGWGLYQMHGNVWEWCSDWYEKYKDGCFFIPPFNPVGPGEGEFKVLRGGSWLCHSDHCQSSEREFKKPSDKSNDVGFRLAIEKENP